MVLKYSHLYTFYKRISLSTFWTRLSWGVKYFNPPMVHCVAFKAGSHDTSVWFLFEGAFTFGQVLWNQHAIVILLAMTRTKGRLTDSHTDCKLIWLGIPLCKCDLWTAWLTTLLSICDQGLSIYTMLGPQTEDKHLLCTGTPIGKTADIWFIFRLNF